MEMAFKLKVKNGRVGYALRSGKDFSAGTLPVKAAERIIAEGEVTRSEVPGYYICVDGEWHFEGGPVKAPKEA
jgi:hypothetical protein